MDENPGVFQQEAMIGSCIKSECPLDSSRCVFFVAPTKVGV